MKIAIRYSYVDAENAERTSSCQVDRDEAIQAAAEALEAHSTDEEATWIYRDDATRTDWRVPAADMAVLGAALLDGHGLGAVYSVWCAGSSAVEIA